MIRTILAAIIIMLALAGAAAAADPSGIQIPEKRVAVMNLKVSGEYSEQVKDWLPALIEDRLLKESWTLVVRGERMRHIQEERSLPGVNPETRLPDNQIIGATAFLELSARVQVKDIQGLVGYKQFTVGDFARASVDVTGQIVDPATGLLKSSVTVGGSASGLKTAAVISIGKDWKIGAGGYNLRGIRESLVGKAADAAADKLITQLKCLYPSVPGQPSAAPHTQLSSTTIPVAPSEQTILLELPDAAAAKAGDKYGVYRGEQLIAELLIIKVAGKRAEAAILSQTSAIQPTDIARKLPMTIKVE
jgi:hypothetical protein